MVVSGRSERLPCRLVAYRALWVSRHWKKAIRSVDRLPLPIVQNLKGASAERDMNDPRFTCDPRIQRTLKGAGARLEREEVRSKVHDAEV